MAVRATGVGLAALGLLMGLAWGNMALAQDLPPPRSAILTLDQDALFERTKFGQALVAAAEQEAEALKTENRNIDAALEAEERALTDRRASLPLADFRVLADAFDTKVKSLRAAQDAKSVAFSAKRDAEQQRFVRTVGPIIGDYMVAQGAVAIVNKAAIVVSLGAVDITDEVIAKIDEKLGDGASSPVIPAAIPPTDGAPTTP